MTWICGIDNCRAVRAGLSETIVSVGVLAMKEARIAELEAALHKAFNQFENITAAGDLKTAHDCADSFIGWAYANLPGYAPDGG